MLLLLEKKLGWEDEGIKETSSEEFGFGSDLTCLGQTMSRLRKGFGLRDRDDDDDETGSKKLESGSNMED